MTARQARPCTRALVLCGAVGLLLGLTGCGGSSDDTKPPTAPPRASSAAPEPSASPADPDAAEKTAVLASYTSMWAEQMKAYRKASAEGTALERYVTAEALGQFRNDLARMQEAGTVVRGDLAHDDTTVTDVDMDATTPTATVQDCLDISKWQTYSTREDQVLPMPSAQPRRYMATATAEKWDDGWIVTRFTPDGSQPC
ncbi:MULTISPECIES: hypothetical protein [Streptomyces]|uniref:hypothetical protein n=1 Tax=Streptomyces TaxID=1883 RepID=UPI0029A8D47A|nr:hypothetical protein [Streptomyces sp. NRRL_B-2557]MDX2748349.1 hypothetical protein [Streptomyces sp. NRRL_B-2557]